MFNCENGKLFLADDLIIGPKYTFDSFTKSSYFNGQDGVKAIKIEKKIVINSEELIVSLIFREGIIYIVSIVDASFECTEKEEPKRKKYHDQIMMKLGIKAGHYSWGEVFSSYDPKGNISSIDVIYY